MKRVKLFALISLLFIGLGHAWGVEGDYELVTTSLDDWSGTYLIAYSSTIFMDGSSATTACNQSTSVSPGNNLSGNTITATWGDKYAIEIQKVTNGYVLMAIDGTYIYSSGNSNNNQSGTLAEASAKPLSITFNTSSDIDITYGGSALHWNNVNTGSGGQRFRFYKDGGQANIYLYRKSGGSSGVTYTDVFIRSRGSRYGGWHNGSTAPCSAFRFTFHCMSKNTRASRSSDKAPLFGSLMVHIVLTDTKKQQA